MGEKTVAAGVLFVALLACGAKPRAIDFVAHSTRMSGKQIADKAILIGEGDIGPVRSAGGLPLGLMTMSTGDGGDEVDEYAAKEAAALGGTHMMPGEWSSETTTTGYVVTGTNTPVWTVIPITHTKRQVKYAVIRVPITGWHRLPAELTPIAYEGKPKK